MFFLLFLLSVVASVEPKDVTSVTKAYGGSFELLCSFPQNYLSPRDFLWLKDGRPVPRGDIVSNSVEVALLKLNNLGAEDVGYYTCSSSSNASVIWNSTFLFVSSAPALIKPLRNGERIVKVVSTRPALIPCRPTSPEISLTWLTSNGYPVDLERAGITFNPTLGFTIAEGSLIYHSGAFLCRASLGNRTQTEQFHLRFQLSDEKELKAPVIDAKSLKWKVGDIREMVCKIRNEASMMLRWIPPVLASKASRQFWPQLLKEEYELENGRVKITKEVLPDEIMSRIVINPVALGDQGYYKCTASSSSTGETKTTPILIEVSSNSIGSVTSSSTFQWDLDRFNDLVEVDLRETSLVKWVVGVILRDDSVRVSTRWLDPRGKEIKNNQKYSIKRDDDVGQERFDLFLEIFNLGARDMGEYELQVVDTGNELSVIGSLRMILHIRTDPLVTLQKKDTVFYNVHGENDIYMNCVIKAFPWNETDIDVSFQPCALRCQELGEKQITLHYDIEESDNTSYASLIIPLNSTFRSGMVICKANNSVGVGSDEAPFVLTDTGEAISIKRELNHENNGGMALSCVGSKILYSSLLWERKGGKNSTGFHPVGQDPDEVLIKSVEDATLHSLIANLTVEELSPSISGLYKCKGEPRHPSWLQEVAYPTRAIERVSTRIPTPPKISGASFKNNTSLYLSDGRDKTLFCSAEAFPEPEMTWFKNGNQFSSHETLQGYTISADGTRLTLLKSEGSKAVGKYTCRATNKLGWAEYSVDVKTEGSRSLVIILLPVFSVVVVAMGCLAFYYFRKSKRATKMLNKKEVEKLRGGDPAALAAAIDQEGTEMTSLLSDTEKALMLPYDRKLEFSLDKLDLGSQIGSGQYGRVLKAQAHKIVEGENYTTVAVKTLKFPAEMEHLKTLMSELKILSLVGRHQNLVNLLGACTERLQHRELYVILEYCHLGNLQQMLVTSRRIFRPEIMTQSKSLGKPISPKFTGKDIRYSVQPLVRSASRSREDYSGPLISSSFAYHEDFLTMGDLFTWALHIAKGMEYLSSKRFLHGDLACRNILLAEDGTAKISDFGLSKNMYHTNLYKKRTDQPLPVKWLAPESMTDHVFSTESDVWSFGVTLWEMFSLGVTPYPGMEPGPRLYEFLMRGERMKCPDFAPGYVYDIMLGCWRPDPEDRLSFSKIIALLVREIRLSGMTSPTTSPRSQDVFFAENAIYRERSQWEEEQGETAAVDSEGYLICLKTPTPLQP